MKKKLALMLATLTTVATLFAGCGEKDVTGDYVATVTLVDFMEESDVEDMAEMGLDISDITLDVTLNLTDDKNFTFAFDTTSFKDDFSSLVSENVDTIIDSSLEASGMTRADLTDEIAQASGYDNADAFFEAMKEELVTSMDGAYEELDEEMEQYTISGTYKVAGDSVVFVTSDEEGIGLDKGTINEDGSITVVTEYEDEDMTLEFKLQ